MEAVGIKVRLFISRVEWATLLAFVFLIAALVSVVGGLVEVVRGIEDWGLILPLLLMGSFLGVLMARMGITPWLAALTIMTVGVLMVLVGVGNLGGKILAILADLPALALEVLHWQTEGALRFGQFIDTNSELVRGMSVLLSRVSNWGAGFVSGQASFDPVAVVLIWSLVLWVVSAWSGWFIGVRADPLLALLPAGILFSASLSYAWEESYWLLLFLGTVLLLKAIMQHTIHKRRWENSGTDYHEGVGVEIGITAAMATIGLVALAWLSPSFSIQNFVDFFEGLGPATSESSQDFRESIGLRSGVVKPEDSFIEIRSVGLPRQHLIGSGPELSEQVVMTVRLENLPGSYADLNLPHRYWRSLTYDIYTGRGWKTSKTDERSYEAWEYALSPESPHQYWIRQEVRLFEEKGGLLFAAGEPATVDADFTVAWRGEDDILGVLVQGVIYRADSLVTEVQEEILREVTGGYPDSVLDLYLGLPESVPPRVLILARGLTATEPTPYDRAIAIEKYLRAIPYTLDVDKPPARRDVVDFFLFDLKEGYCDYYATAMVVMARAAGLPARLATGYIGGSYHDAEASYVVTEAEAHSWVEIYFQDVGWVTFEPTAGRAPLERTAESGMGLPYEIELSPIPPPPEQHDIWTYVVVGAVVSVVLGAFVLLWVDRLRLGRLSPSAVVIELYQRMRRYGAHFPVPLHPGDTPYEFSAVLSGYLTAIAKNDFWKPWLLRATQDIWHITNLVVWEQFSPHPRGYVARDQAIRAWRRLRKRLFLTRICPWIFIWKR